MSHRKETPGKLEHSKQGPFKYEMYYQHQDQNSTLMREFYINDF